MTQDASAVSTDSLLRSLAQRVSDLENRLQDHTGDSEGASGQFYPHPFYSYLSLTPGVITANYTLQLGEIRVFTGTITVTMPPAWGNAGAQVGIKNAGTGVLTIAASGSDLIDGLATLPVLSQYDAYILMSDGTSNWYIV